MRRAARTDENQERIVRILRLAGIAVRVTSAIGEGFPDLLCCDKRPGGGNLLVLMEIKDGSKPPSRRKLTPSQEKMAQSWPIHVVKNEAEALAVFGIHVAEQ